MDQIWLASPSPALRLWPGSSGPTWRLNPAAMAWGRGRQLNEASWRRIAAELGAALVRSPERDGRLVEPLLRWRSLPMNTGWLVWLMPDSRATDTGDGFADARREVSVVGELYSEGPTVGVAAADAGSEAGRIAERERNERLVQRLEMVADAAGAGIWLLDLVTGEARWNRQMFLLHGLPVDGAPPAFDAYVDGFVYPDDRVAFRRSREQAIAAGAARHDCEFRIVRTDGAVRWIECRATREQQSGRASLVGIALDATERTDQRLAAERALREKGALERASAARSEFLARMSHELRTPLNAVLGFAQLIGHDGTAVPVTVQLERVVHIREAGEQLLRLVGDVLDHLKREAPPEEAEHAGQAPLEDDAKNPSSQNSALTVLYIEDNPVNVILVEELVAMRPNTSLLCAVTGLAGVALAAATAPHVVLLDMQLPDIDGFEVLRRLRTNRALDQSAVIALSANGMGEDIARALGAGFDDYWTKPIDFRHFLNGLDALARAR